MTYARHGHTINNKRVRRLWRDEGLERDPLTSITTTVDQFGGLFPSLDRAIATGLDSTVETSLAVSLEGAGHVLE